MAALESFVSPLQRMRARGLSRSNLPPGTFKDYNSKLADLAARVVYKSPLPSKEDLPVYIINAAAFPDTKDVDYDHLLPYVLARLPGEDELFGWKGYEVVFFAGGEEHGPSNPKKGRPGWGWFLQAYHILSRALRKRIYKLYLVHERRWIRVMIEAFGTIVSPKMRKKIVHASTLSVLGLYIAIEDLLIPPAAYVFDRRLSPDIHVPYASGRRAFGAQCPLHTTSIGTLRLPRVLREATSFLLADQNLSTEGIFRVNARAVSLSILKEAYDRGQKFIVWKEDKSVMVFSQWKEGQGNITVEDIEHMDGFGVHSAAGLIKLWYSDLREPIFPQSVYSYLEQAFGNTQDAFDDAKVVELLHEQSERSPLTKTARRILTLHLVPLLSRVAKERERNLMNAGNLAVCIAPRLMCGPNPAEDVRVGVVIRRLLESIIERWPSGLSGACGRMDSYFDELLRLPETAEDREDPLESPIKSSFTMDDQARAISMLSFDDLSDGDDPDPPPLPPRTSSSKRPPVENIHVPTSPIKRKPVPPVEHPPRYSTHEFSRQPQLPLYSSETEESSDSFREEKTSINADTKVQ